MPLGELFRRARGLHALSDEFRVRENVLQPLSLAKGHADAAIPRERAGAGQDQIAHSSETGERLRPSA